MKYFLWFFILFVSCKHTSKHKIFRQDFTDNEKNILNVSRNIIEKSYFATFISINSNRFAKARTIEPISPYNEFIIYFATKPNTRKVEEITKNPKATIHYFDKSQLGYVSMYGKAIVLRNNNLIKKHWNTAWNKYYPDNKFVLIKFIPYFLEMVSIQKKLTGNPKNWLPEKVILRK